MNEVRTRGSVDDVAPEAIDVGMPVDDVALEATDVGITVDEPDFGWGGFGSLPTKTKDKKARKNEFSCCS